MSKSPKYSQAELEEERRRELVRERKRLAEIEAQQRREREEEERRRRDQQAAEHAARMKAEKDARDALNEFKIQLFGLKSDNIIMAWCQSEIANVENAIKELERLIITEQWSSIAGKSSQIKNDIKELLTKAQDRQLKEEIRNYIQKGMGKALAEMGFQVGTTFLEESGNYNSDVVIRARRPDGRFLQVQVPVDGNVSYRVDGYPMRMVSDQGGTQYATCDEAQTVIESFHQRIHQQFGIKMEELKWEGKPPMRLVKDQKELPDHGANTYRKPGG